MKTVSQILSDAADLIEPEGRWTKGEFARRRSGLGEDLGGLERAAVCWCAWGAIRKASGVELGEDSDPYKALAKAVGCWVPDWNDAPERTQAEVVAALREASRQAAEGGQ